MRRSLRRVLVSFAAIMPETKTFCGALWPDVDGMYQPQMVAGLALMCVVGAGLGLLLPRYPAESYNPAAAIPSSELAKES